MLEIKKNTFGYNVFHQDTLIGSIQKDSELNHTFSPRGLHFLYDIADLLELAEHIRHIINLESMEEKEKEHVGCS